MQLFLNGKVYTKKKQNCQHGADTKKGNIIQCITHCTSTRFEPNDASLIGLRQVMGSNITNCKAINIRFQCEFPAISTLGGMEEAMRRALILAYMCLREKANTRTTIREVVDALDDLVQFMARKEKKKNIQYRRGVENEKEEEGFKGDVAEAIKWAEGSRVLSRKNNEQPMPAP